MLAIASQIILCLVLAALLGLIIGYLLGKGNCPKAAYKAVTPVDPHTHDDEACEEETPASNPSDNTAEEVETTEATASAEAEGLLSHPAEEASSEAVSSEEAQPEAKSAANVEKKAASTQAETETKAPAQKKKEPKPSKASNTKEASSPDEAAPDDADKPVGLLDAPRNGEKDNLTRIKGIGVKIEELLNGIGVYHFDQIAVWNEKEAHWIDHQVSFPGRALRDDWIGQAKLLAEGKETEFSKRVDAGEVSSSHTSD